MDLVWPTQGSKSLIQTLKFIRVSPGPNLISLAAISTAKTLGW